MPNGNVSVVVSYEGHGPNDAGGYIQFTRSGNSVFITLDGGRSVGIADFEEFSRVQKLFTSSKESE